MRYKPYEKVSKINVIEGNKDIELREVSFPDGEVLITKGDTFKLYKKNDEYLEIIERHLNNLSYLFGDNGLIYILDKNKTLEEIYFDTLNLKNNLNFRSTKYYAF